jgi:hypothetical protein
MKTDRRKVHSEFRGALGRRKTAKRQAFLDEVRAAGGCLASRLTGPRPETIFSGQIHGASYRIFASRPASEMDTAAFGIREVEL